MWTKSTSLEDFSPSSVCRNCRLLIRSTALKKKEKTTSIPITLKIFQRQCRNAWEATWWVSQFVNVCGISVWHCSHAAHRHAPASSGNAGPPWTPAVARMAFSAPTLFRRVPRKPQHSAVWVSSRLAVRLPRAGNQPLRRTLALRWKVC